MRQRFSPNNKHPIILSITNYSPNELKGLSTNPAEKSIREAPVDVKIAISPNTGIAHA